LKKKKSQVEVQCHIPYDDRSDHPFYHTVHVPYQSVSDVLIDEIDDWDCRYPILIDAPTGLGKTTFVYQELLPRAKRKGKNLLLISNRIALSVQQKLKIMHILESPLQGMLTDKGIQAQEDFGFVRILTYHRLIGFLSDEQNREWCENIEYVIADEAHFFTADSMFNRNCDTILNLITSRFCKAIRIYLTATPWDVLHRLAEEEEKNYRNFEDSFASPRNRLFMENRFIQRYCFERNFDKYDLKFFQDFLEIIPQINENPKDKWLIFIDNKDEAEALMNAIEAPTIYFDSSRKGSEGWSELLTNEQFDSQVLICTSVLDCGVNIHDPALKNIVIVSDNRTSMMQMAGRKRLAENESVTLWIQDLPMQKIAFRYKKYLSALNLEQQFDKIKTDKEMRAFVNQLWDAEDPAMRNLFSVQLHTVTKNKCAYVYISRMARFFDRILKNKTTFQREVENWFEKEHPELVSEIDDFYEKYKNTDLDKTEQEILRGIIARAYKNSGNVEAQPRRTNLMHNALNNRLREMTLPYEIEYQKGFWRLNYIHTESEGEQL